VNQDSDLIKKLSPREVDILLELKKGASNLEIARNLFISENTVKHHIHSILEKLGVENRRQAGDIAAQMDTINHKSKELK